MIGESCGATVRDDKVSFNLGFKDGSFGVIHYLANGNKSFPKERLEVFSDGKILQLSNFLKLQGFGWPKFKRMNLWRQNKGQHACIKAFIDAIKYNKLSPIAFNEFLEVSEASFEVAETAFVENEVKESK
jgi:predicted dehydrogenase